MNKDIVVQILAGALVLFAQILLFRNLTIFSTNPDMVLVYLIWICGNQSRTNSLAHAAILGFFIDFFLDTWGLHMISKTLCVFILYHFIPRITETRLILTQVFVLLMISGLIHNFFYTGLAQFADIFRVDGIFWLIWIGNTLFTAILGSFIYLFKSG